jgi:hypothetical protein
MVKETLEFGLEVAFTSDGYWDAPEKIFMVLDDNDIKDIKAAREFIKSQNGELGYQPIFSVNVEVGNMETDNEDFNSRDVHCVVVYTNALYCYAQSKYDANINIESEPFDINFETGEIILNKLL